MLQPTYVSQYTGWAKNQRTRISQEDSRRVSQTSFTYHQVKTNKSFNVNKRKLEAIYLNHCCRGKVVSIKCYNCVPVFLIVQHAKRMCRIILLSTASLAPPYFIKLSQKLHDFRKKLLNIKSVFCFSLQFCLKYFLL
jgi:hypothetical protein